MGSTRIIALAGKGGVGKTSISSAFVRLLMENYPDAKILAIDADPAVGLSTALGIEVATTLDDIRKDIIASVENGAPQEAIEMLGNARFRIFDTLIERPGFSFLAIGRPETAGCYCKVNAYLKEVIHLLSGSFDYVVIDSPPLGYFSDSEVLSDLADGTLLVVRQDLVPAAEINDAIDALRACRAEFLGCILNDMQHLSSRLSGGRYAYGYGYGYGKYGKYGYGKYGYGRKSEE